MAKTGEKLIPDAPTAQGRREQQYTEPEGRRPPYFGEHEPTLHLLPAHEHTLLLPAAYYEGVKEGVRYVIERLLQMAGIRFVERLLQWKRRVQWRRDPVVALAKEIWPPDGEPPPNMSTPNAARKLGDECRERKIIASSDTLKRAMNRR